jgi:hypothetical protein
MPGIFINDGGATGSSLATALSGIANNYSPQTLAQANMLGLQAEGQGYDNRLKSLITATRENAVGAAPALLTATNSDFGNKVASMSQGGSSYQGTSNAAPSGSTGAGTPGVKSVGANDPNARGVVDTRSWSPAAKIMASQIAQGGDYGDIRSGIELGQQHNLGPGYTYQAQSGIQVARQMPYDRKPEVERVQDPTALPVSTAPQATAPDTTGGATGGPGSTTQAGTGAAAQPKPQQVASATVQGGPNIIPPLSSFDPAAQAAAGKSADTQFNADQETGRTASQALTELSDIQNVWNQVAGDQGTIPGQISTGLQQLLQDKFGITATDKQAVLNEVKSRLSRMLPALRSQLGLTSRTTDRDITLMQGILGDPSGPPGVFNDIANSMKVGLQQSQHMGQIASQWNTSPTMETAARIRQQQADEAGRTDMLAPLRARYPSMAQEVTANPPASTTAVSTAGLRPPTRKDVVDIQNAIANNPKDRPNILKHVRDKGVDTSGF